MNLLEGKRILIVEDNVKNLAIFASVLRRKGATVFQDNWNAGTVNLIHDHLPIDIILLDLMLRHGKSGYDIFDEMAAIPDLKNIPIVAVSAADPDTEIPKAKEKGFAGFIAKPVNISQFPEHIATCIGGEKIWVASRKSGVSR